MGHSNRYSTPQQRHSGDIKAKKSLGQHFLTDETIALRIVESLGAITSNVLEIGPGMGVLTKYMLRDKHLNLKCIEIDHEAAGYLRIHYPGLQIIEGDFLQEDLDCIFGEPFSLIGNFPYNISSQILFKVFEHRDTIPQVVGMFQKEVAERVSSMPGNKCNGILSILLSAFYDIEYLFTVPETVFNPPPKVKSAVIRLSRNGTKALACDEKLFVRVVKAGFNQRRKILRNALRVLSMPLDGVPADLLDKRAEQLSYTEFEQIASILISDS